jgi:hypothetical protein
VRALYNGGFESESRDVRPSLGTTVSRGSSSRRTFHGRRRLSSPLQASVLRVGCASIIVRKRIEPAAPPGPIPAGRHLESRLAQFGPEAPFPLHRFPRSRSSNHTRSVFHKTCVYQRYSVSARPHHPPECMEGGLERVYAPGIRGRAREGSCYYHFESGQRRGRLKRDVCIRLCLLDIDHTLRVEAKTLKERCRSLCTTKPPELKSHRTGAQELQVLRHRVARRSRSFGANHRLKSQ